MAGDFAFDHPFYSNHQEVSLRYLFPSHFSPTNVKCESTSKWKREPWSFLGPWGGGRIGIWLKGPASTGEDNISHRHSAMPSSSVSVLEHSQRSQWEGRIKTEQSQRKPGDYVEAAVFRNSTFVTLNPVTTSSAYCIHYIPHCAQQAVRSHWMFLPVNK